MQGQDKSTPAKKQKNLFQRIFGGNKDNKEEQISSSESQLQKLQIKMIMLGSDCVGKSTCLQKYQKQVFPDPPLEPTLGGAFFTKEINIGTKLVDLHIWDTAGQQRYKLVVGLYIGVPFPKIALIFYSVAERKSFKQLDVFVKLWKEKQKDQFQPSIVIVANMCDRIDRVISTEEGFQVAKKYNTLYIESSSKQNVSHVFETSLAYKLSFVGIKNQLFAKQAKIIIQNQPLLRESVSEFQLILQICKEKSNKILKKQIQLYSSICQYQWRCKYAWQVSELKQKIIKIKENMCVFQRIIANNPIMKESQIQQNKESSIKQTDSGSQIMKKQLAGKLKLRQQIELANLELNLNKKFLNLSQQCQKIDTKETQAIHQQTSIMIKEFQQTFNEKQIGSTIEIDQMKSADSILHNNSAHKNTKEQQNLMKVILNLKNNFIQSNKIVSQIITEMNNAKSFLLKILQHRDQQILSNNSQKLNLSQDEYINFLEQYFLDKKCEESKDQALQLYIKQQGSNSKQNPSKDKVNRYNQLIQQNKNLIDGLKKTRKQIELQTQIFLHNKQLIESSWEKEKHLYVKMLSEKKKSK